MVSKESALYVGLFEIAESANFTASLTLQKVLALHSLLESATAKVNLREAPPVFTPSDRGVIVTAFDDGKLLFDIIVASAVELKHHNEARGTGEHLLIRVGIDCARSPGLPSLQTDNIKESLLMIAVSKAQRLVSFGEANHILISDDFYQRVIVRGLLARYVSYFGRYREREAQEVAVWGFYDPSRQIGNPVPPAAMRTEDEKGIAVYSPPYFKLCKPRIASPEKAQDLATREIKILALSPHPNDIPWGCAGTLMWFRELFDARIYLHFLTSTRAPHVTGDPRYGPPSRPLGPALWSYGILTGKDPSPLIKEMMGLSQEEAIRRIMSKIPRLGRTPHQLYVEGSILDPTLDKPPLPPEGMFSDGYLDKYPNILRDRLSWLQAQIGPDIILSPCLKDIHQDHRNTAEAAMAVFKFQESIWFYELPQASRNPYNYFSPNLFIDVNPYAERKLALLATCFEYDTKRFHFSPEGAEALMRVRAIEAYYEQLGWSEATPPILPHVEAFEARLYFK